MSAEDNPGGTANMADVSDLWKRIEEAKRRLGVAEAAQIKQIEDINDQVKEVRGGLARRYRELEQHREDVSKLRHENEQLRRMLHRLLLAIEQRQSGRLKDLMKSLEGDVGALVPFAAETTQAMVPAEAEPPGLATLDEAAPSETDSRWLHEIMERARELNEAGHTAPARPARLEPPHSAVA